MKARAVSAGLIALALLPIILMIETGQSDSPRKEAVMQLLAAVAADDEAAVARLASPDAAFVWSSGFDGQVGPLSWLPSDGCDFSEMREALDVVAVQFECTTRSRSRFILDFTFCGDRIHQVEGDERGYMFLSPAPRRLLAITLQWLTGEDAPCPTCPRCDPR